MDSTAGWGTVKHSKKHDKLPQNGKCFIHKASDVATKQPGSQPAVWVRFSNKYTTTEKLILSIS